MNPRIPVWILGYGVDPAITVDPGIAVWALGF